MWVTETDYRWIFVACVLKEILVAFLIVLKVCII
jgi:hypothetical protein